MARVMMIAAALLATVLMALPCRARRPFENQWGPFTGTVVDANTGQPIPGAVFTVFWMRTIADLVHPHQEFYDARVAVTDEAGRFEVPRREHAPLLFFADRPDLSCVAPGYAPYHDVGAQNAPMSLRLRPLEAQEREVPGSMDPQLVTIPFDRAREFQKAVNLERQSMGLPPIHFYSANIERGAK